MLILIARYLTQVAWEHRTHTIMVGTNKKAHRSQSIVARNGATGEEGKQGRHGWRGWRPMHLAKLKFIVVLRNHCCVTPQNKLMGTSNTKNEPWCWEIILVWHIKTSQNNLCIKWKQWDLGFFGSAWLGDVLVRINALYLGRNDRAWAGLAQW